MDKSLSFYILFLLFFIIFQATIQTDATLIVQSISKESSQFDSSKEKIRLIINETTSDTITISWMNLTLSPIKVAVYYSKSILGLNNENFDNENWNVIVAKNPRKTNYTITDLLPNTGYDVRVDFMYSNGSKKISELVQLRTQIQIPLIKNLRVENNELKWNPIKFSGSRRTRTSQKILYIVEMRNCSAPNSHRVYIGDWVTVKNTTDNTWKIQGLVEGLYYQFTVYAETSMDRGDSSRPTNVYQFIVPTESDNKTMVTKTVVPSVLSLVIVVFCYCLYQHKKWKHRIIKVPNTIEIPGTIDWELIRARGLPNDYKERLPIIPRSHFEFKKRLGEGAFGEVFEAQILCGSHVEEFVAVKTLKEGATDKERKQFMMEAYFMNGLNHENIITLIGVCENPFYLVLELMEEDLLTYLQNSKLIRSGNKTFAKGWRSKLSLLNLLCIIDDVAAGCEYLESQHFIHRDLAARNCLVSMKPSSNSLVVKIADFGLARDIHDTDIYMKEGSGPLPIRWMAPECISYQSFTDKSDVWSFGVLMLEVMTLGEQPYAGRGNVEVISFIKQGGYPNQPIGTPDNIYDLMVECWSFEPNDRPSFTVIRSTIKQFQENCSKINPDLDNKQSTLLNLLAPTSDRLMLKGFDNSMFLDDEGSMVMSLSDSSAKLSPDQRQNKLQYASISFGNES